MENLLKKSNVKAVAEKTRVCHECRMTLDIKVEHDGNMPGWDTCRFCNKIRWCLTFII